MYGTRAAAQSWAREYSQRLREWGFTQSAGSPCYFFHKLREIHLVVHGDDFVSSGSESEIKWLHGKMAGQYEVKIRGILGPEENDQKSIRILNRIVEFQPWGIQYEPDQRHVEGIINDLDLAAANGVNTPGVKEKTEEVEEDRELDPTQVKMFRRVAAKANFLALDRPDIQYATKEACRGMAKPMESDWRKLKRLARYLKLFPRMTTRYEWQASPQRLDVFTDTDHAGCLRSRKSTSGGFVMHGQHILKSWSSTQAIIALSSGEAEYYGLVKGASEGLGLQSVLREGGHPLRLLLHTDSTAARGIAGRLGLNKKTRHIATHFLWLQQKVEEEALEIRKVPGQSNPADLGTKYLAADRIKEILGRVHIRPEEGRHPLIPILATKEESPEAEDNYMQAITEYPRRKRLQSEERREKGAQMEKEWNPRKEKEKGPKAKRL